MESILKENLFIDDELSFEKLDIFCNKARDILNTKYSIIEEELNSLIAFLRLSFIYIYYFCSNDDFNEKSIYKLIDFIDRVPNGFDLLILDVLKNIKERKDITKEVIYLLTSSHVEFNSFKLFFPSNVLDLIKDVFINLKGESI